MTALHFRNASVVRRYWILVLGVCLVLGSWSLDLHAGTVALTVGEPAGIPRRAAPITSGVPFPIGGLHTNMPLQLLDAQGNDVPLQHRTTATWRDGSVKWALLDFQSDVAANASREFTLKWGHKIERVALTNAITTRASDGAVELISRPLRVLFARTNGFIESIHLDRNGNGAFEREEQVCSRVAAMFETSAPREKFAGFTPDEIVIEESGSLRTVVKVTGWFSSPTNAFPGTRYTARVHAFAGQPRIKVQFTAVNLGTNKMVLVERYGMWISSAERGAARREFGAYGGSHVFSTDGQQPGTELFQTNESRYVIKGPGIATNGVRAAGWARWQNERVSMTAAVRDFWQQFPNALRVENDGIGVVFFQRAGEPFDWDLGLAKTHEVWLDFATNNTRLLTQPETDLFAQAPAQWYCDSGVFGDLAPFNFDLFPDYETLTEASGDKFIKSMATGIRNWGDVYYGGPYKGKNSYMNLEYDVPHNFILQFARTGQRKYLDAARRMAQHQADIDTNHKTGWQWKHSPRHTETQAEFGHTFTRGLLENYYFTGNRTTFDAAVTLGNYFIKQIRNPREMGNERQIGWGLISLLPVYEATWDAKYLEAVRAAVDRLAAEQEAGGKFKIRWDNRIAFFNGIAATGFIYYERATGDPKAAEAALRTIRRTKGFYPEYAGRTLEALAWAYQRTNDPDYLDLLKLTYETTMARQIEWNTMELGAPTIFTVHTLPFLEKSGLVTKPNGGVEKDSGAGFQPANARIRQGRLEAGPTNSWTGDEDALNLTAEQFASENGMHVRHVPAGEGDVWLKVDSTEPFQLALVRKGVWKANATAALYDPSGAVVKEWKLPRESKIWQREVFNVQPKSKGAYRLALRSATVLNTRGGSYVTWDIATSRPIPAVMQTPNFSGLQFVTPYLFTTPRGDSDKIELELIGEGEGFKKAVIYDPAGNVAGTMEAFVDLGDTGRYTYKLSANIPPEHRTGIWRVSLQDVALSKMTGLAPYFSTSKRAFFRPDRE
jgi:hypothetical protein